MAGWTVPGYTGTRTLGSGDAGRIDEAVHDASGALVAITYLNPALCSDEVFRERFRREADLLAGLENENVVRVRAMVESGTELALVTDAVEGAALRRVLAISGPLSPEAALTVLRGSLLGLAAADGVGVVHRDFQPSNVMIGREGTVEVGGFGLAVRSEPMMPAAGTPSYMAPELWEGATPGLASDLYAAAATFYECLTGRVPYSADSVFELQTMHRAAPIPADDVPAALAPLVRQGLAKTPEERPATAEGFVAELDAAAVVEFGLEWEERGRRELAALVAALPGEEAMAEAATSVLPVVAPVVAPVAAVPSGGVGLAEAAGLEDSVGFGADVIGAGARARAGVSGDAYADAVTGAASGAGAGTGAGMGRGTKTGIGAAVVVVIGAVVAAVALSPAKHSAAATRPSGEFASSGSDQASSSDDGDSPGVAGAPAASGPTGARSSASGSATGIVSASSSNGSPGPTTAATSAGSAAATTSSLLNGPLPSPSSWTPPNYPPPSAPSTSGATTPIGSSAPASSPSVAVTVSASASIANGSYSGPCPPTYPTGTVTFTVSGLPTGGSLPITYQWHVVPASGTSASSGSASGNGKVDAQNGTNTQTFTVTDDQHSDKALSGTVEITWSAPGTSGGTISAGSVDVTCTPSGGTSGAGATTVS